MNFLIQEKRQRKQEYKDKHKVQRKYMLTSRMDQDGKEQLVFVEQRSGNKEEGNQNYVPKEIFIGRPVQQQEDDEFDEDLNGDDIEIKEEDDMDQLDDFEKEYLATMLNKDQQELDNIQVFEEEGNAQNKEIIERNYEVDLEDNEQLYNESDNFMEEVVNDEEADLIEKELELDKALKNDNPQLSKESEQFLMDQLFGKKPKQKKQAKPQCDSEIQQQNEIQHGLDFFNANIKVNEAVVNQDDIDQINRMLEDSQISECYGEEIGEEEDQSENEDSLLQDESDVQFKNKRERVQRDIDEDDVLKNQLKYEYIQEYLSKIQNETQEQINDDLQKHIQKYNMKVQLGIENLQQTQQQKLDNGAGSRKNYIDQKCMIVLNKTGVPENVFRKKEIQNDQSEFQYQKVVLPHTRDRGETADERLQRKQTTKAAKLLRKTQKRELKQEFQQEAKTLKKRKMAQQHNVQGHDEV